MTNISVVVPVGPDPEYLKYLPECLQSIYDQTFEGIVDIILIDDSQQINFRPHDYVPVELVYLGTSAPYAYDTYIVENDRSSYFEKIRLSHYRTPWNVGVADAFNFGMALSVHNLVFMLGSDDKMMPTCLEEVVNAYDEHQIEGWYNVTQQVESGEISAIPNNTAAATKKLWEYTGGFPPSAGVAACDALLLSILMKHAPERIIQVAEGKPLCWLREGDYQDTRKNAWYYAQSGIIEQIRNMETLRWKPKN